jgi:hypothetical protein
MKSPQPDLQNLRIIYLARVFVTLPFTVAAAIYRWVKARIEGRQSDKVTREKDQIRQSRARRELRGLPPDHDSALTSRPPG